MKEQEISQGAQVAKAPLRGFVPEVKRNGDTFVTDWHLSDSEKCHHHTAPGLQYSSRALACAVVGTSTDDRHLIAHHVEFTTSCVRLETERGIFDVRYSGQPLRWGGKRTATHDIEPIAQAAGAVPHPGGGALNTGLAINEAARRNGASADVHVVDTSHPWPDLERTLASAGVGHVPLRLTPRAVNLVVTNGGGPAERLILRSPLAAVPPTNGGVAMWSNALHAGLDAVLINSPKGTEVARWAADGAKVLGARRYSVATPSLSLSDRLAILLAENDATVANQDEFVELASAYAIRCPNAEALSSVASVARALVEFVRQQPCGDIVITMGEVGCVIHDAVTECAYYIRMTDEARSRVRAFGKHDRINGSGDRFFGAFVLAHINFHGVAHENSRAVYSARLAWMEVLRSYSSYLRPRADWFNVRVIG